MRFAVLLAFLAAPAMGACDSPSASPSLTVKLPGRPFGVVPSNDGCWLFVSMPAGTISVLHRDLGRVELKRNVKVKGSPAGMVLSHDGKTLIVAAGSLVLFLDVLRLTKGKRDPEIATISDGGKAGSVYVNITPDDKRLFVSDEGAQTITVIDLAHGRKTISAIPVGRAPIALTFSKDGKYLYTTSELAAADWNWPKACKLEGRDPATAPATNPEGALITIDVASLSVVTRVPAGCSPVRLAMSPAGDRIYVTARNSNSVIAFDSNRLTGDPEHARLAQAAVGTAPVPLIVVDGGKTILVGNSNRFDKDQSKRQMLDVLTADPFQVSGHIPAGAFPREMRLSPDGSTLFLTNFSSESLQIIDLDQSLKLRQ